MTDLPTPLPPTALPWYIKVVNWFHLHLAATFAAFGAFLVGAGLLLAESLRKREATQGPLPPVLDPKPAQDRAAALEQAQATAERRTTVEAQIPTGPTPEEERVALMEADELAAEWQRLKVTPRLPVRKGGT